MEEPTIQEFPEVKGKTVDSVELCSDSDFYGITMRFQDKTALTFKIEPSVVASPVLEDWTDGEEKKLKAYRAIRSEFFEA